MYSGTTQQAHADINNRQTDRITANNFGYNQDQGPLGIPYQISPNRFNPAPYSPEVTRDGVNDSLYVNPQNQSSNVTNHPGHKDLIDVMENESELDLQSILTSKSFQVD